MDVLYPCTPQKQAGIFQHHIIPKVPLEFQKFNLTLTDIFLDARVFSLVQVHMEMPVYIGLAVTSHDAALTCEAVFTNVTTTGSVGPEWANQNIGIAGNDAEPLYVAVYNSAGAPAVVYHDDPAAATIDTWTEWIIPLQFFADQGINLTNVDRIAIGLGTQGSITIPGGSGKMYINDIRLYQHREVVEK